MRSRSGGGWGRRRRGASVEALEADEQDVRSSLLG
jgi:hypothetical protein